eukprot:gene6579-7083_t
MNTSPFECPVCFEYYDMIGHVPTTFSCGHSCCISHGTKLKTCPLCRLPINRNLAPNIALRDGAIEYQKVMKGSMFKESTPPAGAPTVAITSSQTSLSKNSVGNTKKTKDSEEESSLPFEKMHIGENSLVSPPPERQLLKVIPPNIRFKRNLTSMTDDITLNLQDLKLGQTLSFSNDSPLPGQRLHETIDASRLWGSNFLQNGEPLFHIGSHTITNKNRRIEKRERRRRLFR